MTHPTPLEAPPRARIAFRVGVVGHRPNKLPKTDAALESIRARITEVLGAVTKTVRDFSVSADAAFYADLPPVVRAVSPLAEGVDRMFASAALDLGCELCCPMPFARAEFENDFAPGDALEGRSLETFQHLLARASENAGLTAFELDGSRDNEGSAYAVAARIVLNQSDLLVAVWDGRASSGAGGTLDTIEQALRYHVPVLWIDAEVDAAASGEAAWMFVQSWSDLNAAPGEIRAQPRRLSAAGRGEDDALARVIETIVLGELAPPSSDRNIHMVADERTRALDYFAERRPRFNVAIVWKAFRDLLGEGKISPPDVRVEDFVEQVRRQWPADPADVPPDSKAPSAATLWTNARLRAHYAWADKRANLYGDAHRSAFVTVSLLAVLAVFLAFVPIAAGRAAGWEGGWILAEFLCLMVIVGVVMGGGTRRWHLRWLEYRVLAELVRQLSILAPLGGGRPLPSRQAHLAVYGDPTRSWMYWQMHAIGRAVGVPDVVVDQAYVREHAHRLLDIAEDQLAYHKHSQKRLATIHHRLQRIALFVFGLSIVAIVVHFGFVAMGDESRWSATGRWLVLVSALAPTFGASLASINNQGEFARLEKRSGAMVVGLGGMREALRAMVDRLDAGETVTVAEVTDRASRMVAMMLEENADWRVVVFDLAQGAS